MGGEFVGSWTKPDMRFETVDHEPKIRLIESGNAVALLPDLVWIGRSPTARHKRSRGRRAATPWVTDLG